MRTGDGAVPIGSHGSARAFILQPVELQTAGALAVARPHPPPEPQAGRPVGVPRLTPASGDVDPSRGTSSSGNASGWPGMSTRPRGSARTSPLGPGRRIAPRLSSVRPGASTCGISGIQWSGTSVVSRYAGGDPGATGSSAGGRRLGGAPGLPLDEPVDAATGQALDDAFDSPGQVGPLVASSTSPRCSISGHGGSWAGPWAARSTPNWSATRCSWPSNADGPTGAWCTTPTAARSTPHWPSLPGWPNSSSSNPSALVGSCYDNAAVESFFATLIRELAWIHQRTTWPTRTDLRTALFDYIEGFYNPERIQQRLGHCSLWGLRTSALI